MRLARRASLVVVLLLLASIVPASAECAWVLWLRMEPERGLGNYAVFRGFGNQRECEKYVRDVKGSEQSPTTWLCLPTPWTRGGELALPCHAPKSDRRTRVVLLHNQAVEWRTPEHGTRQMQRSVLVQVRRTPVKHDPIRSGCPREIPPWHNVFEFGW